MTAAGGPARRWPQQEFWDDAKKRRKLFQRHLDLRHRVGIQLGGFRLDAQDHLADRAGRGAVVGVDPPENGAVSRVDLTEGSVVNGEGHGRLGRQAPDLHTALRFEGPPRDPLWMKAGSRYILSA